jgi:putative FmdB family regulatory protein
MPLYDFHCRACGHEFEALVRGSESPVCPSCQSRDLERLLSGFAFSSEERSQAAAKASRQRQLRARKDEIVAEEEHRIRHDRE